MKNSKTKTTTKKKFELPEALRHFIKIADARMSDLHQRNHSTVTQTYTQSHTVTHTDTPTVTQHLETVQCNVLSLDFSGGPRLFLSVRELLQHIAEVLEGKAEHCLVCCFLISSVQLTTNNKNNRVTFLLMLHFVRVVCACR